MSSRLWLVVHMCMVLTACDGELPLCEPDPDVIATERACTSDAECPCGAHCEQGRCAADCSGDDECGDAEACDRFGRCTPSGSSLFVARASIERLASVDVLTPNLQLLAVGDTAQLEFTTTAEAGTTTRASGDEGLLFRCEPGAEAATACELPVTEGIQTIEVERVALEAPDPDADERAPFLLRLHPAVGLGATVVIERVPPYEWPELESGGRYEGTAELIGAGSRTAVQQLVRANEVTVPVEMDIYPGVAGQVFELRDPSGLLFGVERHVGVVRVDLDPVRFELPSTLYLEKLGTDASTVELVAAPQVESVRSTLRSLELVVLVRLLGLHDEEAPSLRWRISFTRIRSTWAGEPPEVPVSRVSYLERRRGDVPYAIEAGAPAGTTPTERAVAIACSTDEGDATSLGTETNVLGEDLSCDGTPRFFTLDYAQQAATTTLPQALDACARELDAFSEGSAPTSRDCVDPARALGVFANAAALPGTASAGAPADHALAQRAIAQWSSIGGFVATTGNSILQLGGLVDDTLPATLASRSLHDLSQTSTIPLETLLTPRMSRAQLTLPVATLRAPDYRTNSASVGFGPAAAQLRSLARSLELRALALERDHLGSASPPDGLDEWRRWVITGAALAYATWSRMNDGDASSPPEVLTLELLNASHAFFAAWGTVATRIEAMARQEDPLGLGEGEVPVLRTGDEETPTEQLVASSSFLLGGEPWVSEIHARVRTDEATAATAWNDHLTRTFRNAASESESIRRLADLRRSHATTIRNICGLDFEVAEMLVSPGAPALDTNTCYLSETMPECLPALPSSLSEADVFLDLCQAAVLASYGSSSTFVVPDAARAGELEALVRQLGEGSAADVARELQVSTSGADFVLSRGSTRGTVTPRELARLNLAFPTPAPVPVPNPVGYSPERFSAATVEQLDTYRPMREALTLCRAAVERRFGGAPRANAVTDLMDREVCYRGSLGEAALAARAAETDLEIARIQLEERLEAYEVAVTQCRLVESRQELQLAERRRFRRESAPIRYAIRGIGIASQVLGFIGGKIGPSKLNAENAPGSTMDPPSPALKAARTGIGAVQGILSVATQVLRAGLARMERTSRRYAAEIDRDAARRSCMNRAAAALVGMRSSQARIERASLDVSLSLLRFNNLAAEARSAQVAGQAALAQEANLGPARLEASPWIDEALSRYDTSFRLSRRLTYLAVLATESEMQVSDPAGLRRRVLTARSGAELSDARDELSALVAGGVVPGGDAVGAHFVVLSLRDDLLHLTEDRTDLVTEQRLPLRQLLHGALTDPRNAIYDESGEYAGQRLAFTLGPPSQEQAGLVAGAGIFSRANCAERIVSVAIGVRSEGGADVPSLTNLVLAKANVHRSQSCADPEAVLSFSTRAARNLLLDPVRQSDLFETVNIPTLRPFVRSAFNNVPTSTTRQDVENVSFGTGAQSGFAGRGLFGEYTLTFPADFIRFEECSDVCVTRGEGNLDLSAVEDVFLRFDYVAATRQ